MFVPKVLATEGLVLSLRSRFTFANLGCRLLGSVVSTEVPMSVFADLANKDLDGRLTSNVRKDTCFMHSVQSTGKDDGVEHS